MKTPTLLLRLKSKYRYWKLNSYSENERTYPTIANSAIALQPNLFNTIQISSACIHYFDSYSKTIIDLIDILDDTNRELKKNVKVTKVLLLNKQTVSIESFLQDNKSRYIDAPRAITIFQSLVLEYHLLYQDLIPFDLGIEGYNKRVLSMFTQNLSTITNQLRSYSLG